MDVFLFMNNNNGCCYLGLAWYFSPNKRDLNKL